VKPIAFVEQMSGRLLSDFSDNISTFAIKFQLK
jgi:hypothetical protein